MQDNVRSKWFWLARLALLGGLAFGTACSTTSAPDSAAPPPDAPADETPAEDESSAPAERPAACSAIDDELRTKLERNAKKDAFDTVLVWSNAECPPAFLTAGPSKLDEHRLFRIGSITKTYVSVLALGLAAEGRLSLDDRVDRWLPDIPAAVAGVTVRQLLQHTSGLFNYTDSAALRSQRAVAPKAKYTPRELVDFAVAEPAYFAPGEGWHYTNTGYIVLGMVLEAASGMRVGEVLRERVLAPNELDETFFDGEEAVVGELATGRDAKGRNVTSKYDPSWAWTAGALVASPKDTARFVELLGQGKLLPAKQQAELTATTQSTGQGGLGYGLGVFVADKELTGAGEEGVGHGGDINGYHTWAWHFPKQKLTLFAGVNSDKGNGNAGIATALTTLFPADK